MKILESSRKCKKCSNDASGLLFLGFDRFSTEPRVSQVFKVCPMVSIDHISLSYLKFFISFELSTSVYNREDFIPMLDGSTFCLKIFGVFPKSAPNFHTFSYWDFSAS